jgi:hypothetical protein
MKKTDEEIQIEKQEIKRKKDFLIALEKLNKTLGQTVEIVQDKLITTDLECIDIVIKKNKALFIGNEIKTETVKKKLKVVSIEDKVFYLSISNKGFKFNGWVYNKDIAFFRNHIGLES